MGNLLKLFLWPVVILSILGCQPQEVHVYEDDFHSTTAPTFVIREVLSGDSIKLGDGRIIKYYGVTSPQLGEPLFQKCRNENLRLLRSGRVRLEFPNGEAEKDEQGRYLAYVYRPISGLYVFINYVVLEKGCATVDPNTPKHKYSEEYTLRQEYAKQNKLVLWSE